MSAIAKTTQFLRIGLPLLLVAAALGGAWLYRDALLALVAGDGESGGRGRPPPLVETVAVQPRRVTSRIAATGTLEAPESVTLTARGRGRVAEVLFEEGDAVSAGTPLLRLERERAAARVDEARARVTETRRNLTRLRELRDGKFVSATDLDRADAAAQAAAAALALAEEDLADRVVEAPFAGLVGRRLVSPGALLEPGTPVASLRRNDPLDLLLDVPEAAIGRVANGQRVTATTPAFPGKTFSGDVTFVGTRVDPATRTLALEATFPNPDGLLKPGMFLQAEVVTGSRELLTVPEAAVIARGPTEHLFVLRPATGPEEAGAPRARSGGQAPTVRRREVETGLRRAGWIAIDAGVTAGERVVVAGLQGLRDGATVRTGPPPGTAAGDGGPPEAGTAPADTDSGQGAAAGQGQPAQ